MSWLSDEESSSESTVGSSSAPPSKLIRKTQPTIPSATMSASLKVPSKKDTSGQVPRIDNKSPVASKRLPQKPSKILLSSSSTVKIASKPTSSSSLEVNRTSVTSSPSSLMIKIPLPLVKQQQQPATPIAPTSTVVKKTLGSGSSSLSSSDDLSDSDSEPQANDVVVTPTTTPVTPASAMELVKTTILRVPHSTAPNRTVNVVTKQIPATETAVTKATTISQVISKPTLTIPSQQQLLLKPLSTKNASNISQRLASIYSPTQVKAFQLTKSATSPKTTGTLPFAAFTWSNRTTSSSTTITNTTDSTSSGFTLLSPSNATKLQLPFTSLTSNQTGAFRVIAQTAPVSTTNDTVQQNVTQQ